MTRRSCLGPRSAPLAALLIVAGLCGPATATPWTRDQGRFYLGLNYAFISAKSLYAANFETRPITGYTQHTVGLYGEVGLVDRWLTAVVDTTLYRRSDLADKGYAHGLGDLRLGLWSGVLTAPIRVSLGLLVGLPTGDPAPGNSGKIADSQARGTANSLPTGDGEVDVEVAAAAGHSFGGHGGPWPLEHYALVRLGYWLRTTPREVAIGQAEDFPDAFNWQFELGTRLPWRFVERFWTVLRVFGSESFAGPQEASTSGLGGGVTHRSIALQLYARIWRTLGVSVAAAGALSARSLPAGAQYTVSLSYQR